MPSTISPIKSGYPAQVTQPSAASQPARVDILRKPSGESSLSANPARDRHAFFRTLLPPAQPVALTGDQLTPTQIVQIARHGAPVTITDEATQRIKLGFKVLLQAAAEKKQVYGLTTGVGEHKVKSVFSQTGEVANAADSMPTSRTELATLWKEFNLPAEMLTRSIKFNSDNIDAHTFATGEPFNREIVRGGMTILLNKMAKGELGVYSAIVDCLKELLNKDITPLVPKYGSLGHSDLALMSSIGQVMLGRGWVVPKEQKNGAATPDDILEEAGLDPSSPTCPRRIMRAKEALDNAGIEPIEMIGKDFLSNISTNAMTAGSTAIAVHDTKHFLQTATVVSSMCLQAMNGNVDTLLAESAHADVNFMAEAILATLKGSSLWENDAERPLQDVSSYRVAPYRLGGVLKKINSLETELRASINHPDTNPRILLDLESNPKRVLPKHIVKVDDMSHAIVPSSNFEFDLIDQEIKGVLESLMSLSTQMVNTVTRLEDGRMTKLPNHLIAPGNGGAGLTYVEIGAAAMNDKIHATAKPAYSTNIGVARQVEDLGNAAPLNAEKLHEALTHMYSLMSFQLLFAVQAISLREKLGKTVVLSPPIQELYNAFQKIVPFQHEDREISSALGKASKLLKGWH